MEDNDSSSRREAYFFSVRNHIHNTKTTRLLTHAVQFGQGSRTCIGKNISLLEISKAIPQVIRYMDFELENEGEWEILTHWFTKPKNFLIRVKRREL